MKILFTVLFSFGVFWQTHAQTLFIPNGTNGIGNTSNGVGIGISNPKGNLEVYDNSGVQSAIRINAVGSNAGQASLKLLAGYNSINRAARIDFYNATVSQEVPRWTLLNDYNQDGVNSFDFVNGSNSRVFTILQNGNIGIGTNTPFARLDLRNQFTNPVQAAYIEQGEFNQITLQLKNTNPAAVSPLLQIDNSTSTIFCVKPQGNVGIGTVDPQNKLDVNGSINISGQGLFAPSTNLRYGIFPHSDVGIGIYSCHGGISFWGGGTPKEYMRIINGNILINKANQTDATFKLDVDGKIRANEIVVNTSGADFVFEPTYKLRTLSELEAFIKANKHLPDIAPAKEMQENGVSAGEMQTKLLQKIEELTLYLFEQNKILDQQNENIKKLEIRNDLLEMKIKKLESNHTND